MSPTVSTQWRVKHQSTHPNAVTLMKEESPAQSLSKGHPLQRTFPGSLPNFRLRRKRFAHAPGHPLRYLRHTWFLVMPLPIAHRRLRHRSTGSWDHAHSNFCVSRVTRVAGVEIE